MTAMEKFLIVYVFFLFGIVFLMGLGWTEMFEGYEGLDVPVLQEPTDNDLTNLLSGLGYYVDNIFFFFSLMIIPSDVSWVVQLIFSPAIVIIMFIIITKLIIPAIQSLPFT